MRKVLKWAGIGLGVLLGVLCVGVGILDAVLVTRGTPTLVQFEQLVSGSSAATATLPADGEVDHRYRQILKAVVKPQKHFKFGRWAFCSAEEDAPEGSTLVIESASRRSGVVFSRVEFAYRIEPSPRPEPGPSVRPFTVVQFYSMLEWFPWVTCRRVT